MGRLDKRMDWITAEISILTPADVWKTRQLDHLYTILLPLPEPARIKILREVAKQTEQKLTDVKKHFNAIFNEHNKNTNEDAVTSPWTFEKNDDGWWCTKQVRTITKTKKDEKGEEYEDYEDVVDSFIINGKIVGKGEIHGRIIYLIESNDGKYDIVAPHTLESRLEDSGAPHYSIMDLKQYFANMPALPQVEAYGFNQNTLTEFYLPPQFFAKNMSGLGTHFIRHFQLASNTHNDLAITAYKKILYELAKNIGAINTWTIAGFSVASTCKDYILAKIGIFPLIHCKGPGGKGKTAATKIVANIANLPKEIEEENIETAESPAVFSQLLSAGYYPIVIEEPQGETDVFKKILPVLLQIATTPYARRRLNQDGSIRDEVMAYRSPIIISNLDIPQFNNPQASSRVIELQFNNIKKDTVVWSKLITEYRTAKGSIMSWLYEQSQLQKLPDIKAIFDIAWKKTNEWGQKLEKDIDERTHLRVVSIIFGLYLLHQLFNMFDSEEQFNTIVEDVYRHCNGCYKDRQNAVNLILGACNVMYERYLKWEACTKDIDNSERKLRKLEEDCKEDGHPIENFDSVQQTLNEIIRQRHGEKADLQNRGLCRTTMIMGSEWFVISDDNLPKMKKEMNEVPFACQSKEQLKAFLESIEVPVSGRSVHIPWFSSDETRTKYCLCFPRNIDLIL